MKTILYFLFILSFQFIFGQNEKSNSNFEVKTSRDNYYYSEEDQNGNDVFSKNVGMNGPITMIFANDYDSLNRITKSYWVHSNLGYSLSETVYTNNSIENYQYKLKIDTSFNYDRDLLNTINTRKEFLDLKVFYFLQNGERRLTNVDYLDSLDNIIQEIYFSENGDTSSINTYVFNDKNEETSFHKFTLDSEDWSWDIYYLYDENSNKIKSTRISNSNGKKDTTEVYSYFYNDRNLITLENYYYKKQFRNKSEYSYNNNNQITSVLFYGDEEDIVDAKTIYKYSKKGKVTKKIIYDYRVNKKDQKEVFKMK